MTMREALLAHLAGGQFNLLVIGGGIVGAGIARDAAMRGLSVALIEQGDFASGTSSKTSKLIHGGLRYLEHGRVRLVYESLRERHRLRAVAPQLVRLLPLLLPVYVGDRRPAWKIRAGLSLYDLLSLGRSLRHHRWLSARQAAALEPGLRREGLAAAGLYADCQMDDARLCLANVLQAASLGAVCGNYLRLVRFLAANGRLCGGVVEDALTGRAFEIHAHVVINAAGPWADRVRRLSDSRAAPRLAPNKGIHLVLPRLAQEALFVQARRDGRMLFILPWGDLSLVGTTESAVDGPLEELSATAEEVGYLLEEVNRVLPGAHAEAEQILATFAGARPLLAHAGAATRASREHRLEVDAQGLVSVLGGKFTTYRLMAQQVVDAVIAQARWKATRCQTGRVSLLEATHPVAHDHWRAVTAAIDPDLLGRLLLRYGAGALGVLQILHQEPALTKPLCPHHEVIEAEVVHAVQGELACTVTDVLARRTRIAWSPCHGLDALPTVASLIERAAGLSPAQRDRQVEAYRHFLASTVALRHVPAATPNPS